LRRFDWPDLDIAIAIACLRFHVAAGAAFEFSFLVFVHDFFDFSLLSRAGHCHRSGYKLLADKRVGPRFSHGPTIVI
jgi:hypothetical protein